MEARGHVARVDVGHDAVVRGQAPDAQRLAHLIEPSAMFPLHDRAATTHIAVELDLRQHLGEAQMMEAVTRAVLVVPPHAATGPQATSVRGTWLPYFLWGRSVHK